MQGLNIWNMITTYYITSPVWLVLSIVAILYIILSSNKDVRRKLLLCVLFAVLFILNEVSYHVLTKIFDQASYYRFLWVVPYGMIVAYALMHSTLSIIDGKKTKETKLRGLLLIVGVVSILYVTQGNYFERLKNDFPQNKYLVADDILEINAILDRERVLGACETEPTIACSKEVMMQYQTVDAGCIVSTSRVIYLQVRDYGADVSELATVLKDGYLLSTICEDNAQPDVIDAKAAILRQQVDYLIVHANAGMEGYMESLDCSLVGTTQSYLIYHYNYPWYDKVTDEAAITSMKEMMAIQEDEIVVDLGLETGYTILALNDMHVEAMDQTVVDSYRQTVTERFTGMFRNPNGISSVDMWNGISSIVDSYEADGIVFVGDMIDYNSTTNADLLQMGLDKLETPYTYLRADHDLGVWYTDGAVSQDTAIEISKGIAPWQEVFVTDYSEFYLVGWNNSTSQLSEDGLQQMKAIFERAKQEKKPILLATHVPINSVVDNSLEKESRKVDSQGRAKLWGKDCLYQPNETTQKFLDMILAEDSPVKAVFAGHLHFKYTVPLNENITEYVLDKSFSGNVGVIRVE